MVENSLKSVARVCKHWWNLRLEYTSQLRYCCLPSPLHSTSMAHWSKITSTRFIQKTHTLLFITTNNTGSIRKVRKVTSSERLARSLAAACCSRTRATAAPKLYTVECRRVVCALARTLLAIYAVKKVWPLQF